MYVLLYTRSCCDIAQHKPSGTVPTVSQTVCSVDLGRGVRAGGKGQSIGVLKCLRTPGSQQSRTKQKWLDVIRARQLILSRKSFSMKHVRINIATLSIDVSCASNRACPPPGCQNTFPIAHLSPPPSSPSPLCAPRPSIALATQQRCRASTCRARHDLNEHNLLVRWALRD
jgi:hypothetical protein